MNINRVCFAGHLTAEPEVNYSPNGTAVVSVSIANNEFYGCAGSGVGHLDHDRYYHEGQSDHPWDRRACVNKCFSEAGSDGAGRA